MDEDTPPLLLFSMEQKKIHMAIGRDILSYLNHKRVPEQVARISLLLIAGSFTSDLDEEDFDAAMTEAICLLTGNFEYVDGAVH